jgi:hypothetical protein
MRRTKQERKQMADPAKYKSLSVPREDWEQLVNACYKN